MSERATLDDLRASYTIADWKALVDGQDRKIDRLQAKVEFWQERCLMFERWAAQGAEMVTAKRRVK